MAHSISPTRHFYVSLQSWQELKGLQPQLYSAAEYCEASFLFNEQKQVVLQNLKDYVVKAIVNTVDHLGTVSYNLEEVLSLQISEISSTGIRIASLAERLHWCREYKDLEVLSDQRPTRADRRYHRHYVLQEQRKGLMEFRTDEAEISQSGPGAGKTLLWYLTAEHSISSEVAHQIHQSVTRVPPWSIACGSPSSDESESDSSSTTEDVNQSQNSLIVVPEPMATSHISFDEAFGCHQRGNASSWHRGFLSSLLRRKRN